MEVETGIKSGGTRAGVRSTAAALGCALALALGTAHLAVAGDADDLDPTFGDNGRVFTSFDDADASFGLTVQPDGKLIAVGYTYSYETFNQRLAIARYNTDGSLDTSFSTDGKVMTDFPGGPENALSAGVDSAGRIVVMGQSYGPTDEPILVARYNTDGSLDSSFSGDGRGMFTFVPGEPGFAISMVLDGSDRPVLAGMVESDGSAGRDFGLLRLTTNGLRDPTFDGDGVAITDFGTDLDIPYDLAVQGGQIVSVGRSSNDFAIARHTNDGELDDTFSGDGRVITDFTRLDAASDVALRPNGSLVIAGRVTPGDNMDFGLAQYEPDGELDTAFGDGGLAMTDFGHGNEDNAYYVALGTDGDAFVTGESVVDTSPRAGLARYDSDGVQEGKLLSTLGPRAHYGIGGFALQADGKPVLSGVANPDPGTRQFALVRFNTVLDDEPPNTVIDAAPSAAGNDPDPVLEFSATDPAASFECRLRRFDPWAPCTSPHQPGPLADRGYSFTVRAIGTNGEPDATPALRSFIVDTVAPDTSASGKVKARKGTVSFTGSDPHPGTPTLTFKCALDGAAAEPCASPAVYPGLDRGRHTVHVSATDRAGNTEAEPAKVKLRVGDGG